MKKLPAFIIFQMVATMAHAQWTTSGNNISNSNTGSVTIGIASPTAINASAGLFPGAVPKFELVTGSGGATPFADVVTIRHPGATSDILSRQIGLVLKLSSESTTTETDKMGGMLLESASGYANSPTMSLVTANTRRLTIDQSGNIGINTTDTKGYKLGVNGSVIATSVVVKPNANWPDYVFKAEYRLPSLNAVKNYLDRNHHLPEMPSSEEVKKAGVDVGEMNRLLLKKVEELTLYVIQQEKQLKLQQKQIRKLQGK